jgi:hypothetical protein
MRILATLAVSAALLAADKPEKGFTSLFNGKNLEGWTKSKENEASISIEDGAIKANGPRCIVYYTGSFQNHEFRDFELKVDVMTKPVSNGGIHILTKYQETGWPAQGFEVQVNNSYEKDFRKTGSLYQVADNKENVADDNKWFTEHVIVKGNRIEVFVDGKKVTDWTQPEGWKGTEGWPGRIIQAGTIGFQAHDPGSTVYYKNVRIKPLK